ncbi:MAG: hypothetical protein J0I20_02650 [Chloroflexi bacterium]|nr:hypothetical protein [Chloroflexota bacterium]
MLTLNRPVKGLEYSNLKTFVMPHLGLSRAAAILSCQGEPCVCSEGHCSVLA